MASQSPSRLARSLPPRVLVVGGGPVGMATAFMLEKLYNVPARVVERQQSPTSHPQAHFVNLRTMELLYATMPDFHDSLLAQAAPSALWRDYVYCTGVGKAREFARIDQFGSCIPRQSEETSREGLRAALAKLSPTQFLHFPQHRFESLLDDFLAANDVHVERGVALESLTLPPSDSTSSHQTHVTLRHLDSNHEEQASYDFVVGADGAHSLVRQLCGVEMAGTRNLQSIANVHFTSQALSRAARENPGMLYFVFNPEVVGVLIAHDLTKGEWVFQIPFFPPQESVPWDFSVDQCKQLVRHLLPKSGTQSVDDVDVLSVGQWCMGARVAKQYDAGQQRVFLVGDAAHQFPPAGGFGMNTGLQDAHNLAWKLALAVQNASATSSAMDVSTLLGSYGRERQRIAKLNTQFSLRNVARTMKVPQALNVSHDSAQTLAKLVNSAPMQLLPLRAQRELAQRAMRLGKMPLGLLDQTTAAGGPGSALGDHMRQSVQQLVARRASLGMMFYHFDIGFSYNANDWSPRAKQLMQDAALDHAASFRTAVQDAQDVIYAPAFRVGERFPHLWCSLGSGDKVSTLDLSRLALPRSQDDALDSGLVQFVLVVGGRDAAAVLRAASSSSSETLAKHVAVVVLRSRADGDVDAAVTAAMEAAHSGFSSVCSWQVLEDDEDANQAWETFMQSKAAALVRPDGHVGALWTPQQLQDLTSDSLTHTLQHAVQLS